MSNFTKTFTIDTTFEDDAITLIVSRMKRKDALKLVPYMGEPDENGELKIDFKGQIELLDIAADLLPKYIESMTGLKDAEGTAITVEEMLDGAYFLDLIGNIINDLMVKSFMSKKERKKLKEQPVSTSGGSQDISPST